MCSSALFVADADMLHQKLKRRLLGYFQRALDFVHGGDAIALLHRGNVERRAPLRPHSSSPYMGECMEWKVTPVLRNQLPISRMCWRSV